MDDAAHRPGNIQSAAKTHPRDVSASTEEI